MLQHVVLLRFSDSLPDGHEARVVDALQAYVATLPGVRSYRCGPNLGAATNHHFGITATFDDVDGWRAYDEGAEHQRIRAELIAPYATERAAIQFAYDG